MEQTTTLNQCNDLIEHYKNLAFEADKDYQFSLAEGDFKKVADAKKRLSIYRKEIGQLVKTRLRIQK